MNSAKRNVIEMLWHDSMEGEFCFREIVKQFSENEWIDSMLELHGVTNNEICSFYESHHLGDDRLHIICAVFTDLVSAWAQNGVSSDREFVLAIVSTVILSEAITLTHGVWDFALDDIVKIVVADMNNRDVLSRPDFFKAILSH